MLLRDSSEIAAKEWRERDGTMELQKTRQKSGET